MRKEFEAEEEEAKRVIGEDAAREAALEEDRERMRVSRKGDNGPDTPERSPGSRRTLRGRK
jgi:hypothetical protein